MVIDTELLDKVSEQAKASPRLRMNYNFHQSLDDKCHRFLNAVEPGTEVPIHKHPTKDETFVILWRCEMDEVIKNAGRKNFWRFFLGWLGYFTPP